MLTLAARAGLRGHGRVEPNPMVGCVIEREGRVLGIGHHRRYGLAHAEVDALENCRFNGHDPTGSTAWVTLEPCAHQGKQPPCVEALIAARVARVVAARRDPNPEARGGLERLASAGIAAEVDPRCPFAAGIADPFVKRVVSARDGLVLPWVTAKWAQTIDGRTATRTGESKWISSEASRARVHRLRGRVDAILTGIGTVLADDPMLTPRVRRAPRKTPLRVVADSDLTIPPESNLVLTARERPLLVACARELTSAGITAERRAALERAGAGVVGVRGPGMVGGRGLDLRELLHVLAAERSVSTVLVEAGAGLVGSLLQDDLIDEAVVYIAPLLLGDEYARAAAAGRMAETLSAGKRFRVWRVKRVGDDVEITYRRLPTL